MVVVGGAGAGIWGAIEAVGWAGGAGYYGVRRCGKTPP